MLVSNTASLAEVGAAAGRVLPKEPCTSSASSRRGRGGFGWQNPAWSQAPSQVPSQVLSQVPSLVLSRQPFTRPTKVEPSCMSAGVRQGS